MSGDNGKPGVVEGEPADDVDLSVVGAFAGVSADELELVLEILRSVTLEGAEAKILAGQFQLRVRGALESSR